MIGAIVLAAGLSRRMGRPKPALPWGETTIVGHIADMLAEGGADEIVVVTGGAREAVEEAVGEWVGTLAPHRPALPRPARRSRGGRASGVAGDASAGGDAHPYVRCIFNPDFERGEMLSSIQAGLRAMPEECEAALIALGDQPQIEAEVVRAVIAAYRETGAPIVAPSYQMRRGHPNLLARTVWPDLLALAPPASLRDFLSRERPIHYVTVNTPTVLADMDTPEDYRSIAPNSFP